VGAPPLPAKSVELVDEEDAGCAPSGVFEERAHPARAPTNIHLHKVRARARDEWHARSPGDRFGEERLAGAGRSGEEEAARATGADGGVSLGMDETVDHLHHLVLDARHTPHITEAHVVMLAF